jgi:glycosyltransferase involved in cell wall biosynthesis
VYTEPNRVDSYAQAIVELLDDEPRRQRMGSLGRVQIEQKLAWSHQRGAYVAVYDRLLGLCPSANGSPGNGLHDDQLVSPGMAEA